MDARKLLKTMTVIGRLKDMTRHSWTAGGRRESVAEHSWRLCTMAYFMRDEFPEADMDKVLHMCLVHDIGEAFTGDVPSFEKTDADEEKESRMLSDWVDSLPEAYREELRTLYSEMDALETLEAKIYKALDKMEAVIQHNEADLSTWIPLEHTLNLSYGLEEAEFHKYLKELRNMAREDSKAKIANEKKA